MDGDEPLARLALTDTEWRVVKRALEARVTAYGEPQDRAVLATVRAHLERAGEPPVVERNAAGWPVLKPSD